MVHPSNHLTMRNKCRLIEKTDVLEPYAFMGSVTQHPIRIFLPTVLVGTSEPNRSIV